MIARSKIIEKSLGCLDFGMASLMPGLGVFAALVALDKFRSVVGNTDDRWNPARWQLFAGAALALLSLLAHAILGVFLYLGIMRAIANA